MDYEQELKAFYDWLATNSMKPPAIALWHALMYIASISGWPNEFTIRQSVLESYSGLCADAIRIHRNTLKQKKRIDFRSQRGNQSCVYHIIPFVPLLSAQTQSQEFVPIKSAQTQVQTPVQTTGQSTFKAFVPIKSVQTPVQTPFAPEIVPIKTAQIPLYKGIYYDDGDDGVYDDDDLQDSELARARGIAVETVESSGKPRGNVESQIISLDSYTGMTPELKAQVMTMADQLTWNYFGRRATVHDATKLYERIRDLHPGPAKIDSERMGLVVRVFQTAAEDGVFKWKYIDGILSRCARRGIHTADDFERYEAQRDFDKDNRR